MEDIGGKAILLGFQYLPSHLITRQSWASLSYFLRLSFLICKIWTMVESTSCVCYFSASAVTNFYLKLQKFNCSQLLRQQVQNPGLRRCTLPPNVLGEIPLLYSSGSCWHALACGCITPVSTSSVILSPPLLYAFFVSPLNDLGHTGQSRLISSQYP